VEIVREIFSYLARDSRGPPPNTLPAPNSFLPMEYKLITVDTQHPPLVLKAVVRPLAQLARTKYLRTWFTNRIFTEAYCAHITCDLLDASIARQGLEAPWAKLWRGILRLLLTIDGNQD
jgi:hypothetical protein